MKRTLLEIIYYIITYCNCFQIRNNKYPCTEVNRAKQIPNTELIFPLFFILTGFFYFLSAMFILITTLVGILKKEKDINRLTDSQVKINVLQNYKLLWDIFKLPSIRVLALALLTMKVK